MHSQLRTGFLLLYRSPSCLQKTIRHIDLFSLHLAEIYRLWLLLTKQCYLDRIFDNFTRLVLPRQSHMLAFQYYMVIVELDLLIKNNQLVLL